VPKVSITPPLLKEGLVCPPDKRRIELCCNQLPGFFIEVRKTTPGLGTYYLRYKDCYGKTTTIKIGLTTDITLKDARAKAEQLRTELSLGKDPKKNILDKRNVPTFDTFFTELYLPYAKEHKRTWSNDKQMFDTHLKANFGGTRLNQINRASVQRFHQNLRKSGLSAATCDHYAKLMRLVLNHAVDWDVIESNQLAKIKLFHENNKTERYMNDDELSRLLEVLRTHQNRAVCDIVLYLLSTGARLNEALQARWEHVDIDSRVWRVPAIVSKSKKMRAIPLNDTAIEVLKSVGTRSNHEFVFVNKRTELPYKCIKKSWSRIRDTADLPKLRLHDLRHQFASMLVNSGRSLYEVQHILGHSDPKDTLRYAHFKIDTLQAAADTVSVRLNRPKKASDTPSSPPPVALKLVPGGKG
jgi:integrase